MSTIFSERMFTAFKVELGACAGQLGLPESLFQEPDVEISIESYHALLDCGARRTRSDLGLHMGRRLKVEDLGALGHAAAAAPTLGAALGTLAQYLYVFAHGNVIRVDLAQSLLVVSYRLTDTPLAVHRHDVEFATSLIAKVIRDLCGQPIDPVEVELAHGRPAHAAALADHFGCTVRFDRAGNRLHYHRKILDFPVVSADRSLREAVCFYLADRLRIRDEDEDLATRVRHLIAVSLGEGAPEIDAVARTLGLSRRTLQRRLRSSGLVFKHMVDEVRAAIAAEYVTGSDLSLTDIALMLGYGELSSFSRAYRRWMGASPQQARGH